MPRDPVGAARVFADFGGASPMFLDGSDGASKVRVVSQQLHPTRVVQSGGEAVYAFGTEHAAASSA